MYYEFGKYLTNQKSAHKGGYFEENIFRLIRDKYEDGDGFCRVQFLDETDIDILFIGRRKIFFIECKDVRTEEVKCEEYIEPDGSARQDLSWMSFSFRKRRPIKIFSHALWKTHQNALALREMVGENDWLFEKRVHAMVVFGDHVVKFGDEMRSKSRKKDLMVCGTKICRVAGLLSYIKEAEEKDDRGLYGEIPEAVRNDLIQKILSNNKNQVLLKQHE